MNTPFKTLFSDKIIWTSLMFSCLLYAIAIVVVAFSYHNLPPFLPLFNKLAWGYTRLGRTYQISIPIILPLFLSFGNIFLEKYVYGKVPLLARLLSLISLLLALFTCVFIIKLVLIIL